MRDTQNTQAPVAQQQSLFETLSSSNQEEILLSWLRLIRDRRWSRSQKHLLLDYFVSPIAIYSSADDVLRRVIKGRFRAAQAQIDSANLAADLKWLTKPEHNLVTRACTTYPKLLAQVYDAPLALFTIGNLKYLRDPKIAVVGSRRPTPIGAKVVGQLASELAESGLMITSGMALGVDGLAHQAALHAGHATIAVMACGLDHVYPTRHRKLHSQIAETGLIVSEYPLAQAPSKYTFPQRNRIVSGLSLGVLIVEAAERSGTLITARLAAEQNREVMVVPGSSLSKQYRGSHRLIQQGASLVTSTDDILFSLQQPLGEYCAQRSVSAAGCGDSEDEDANDELLRHIGFESTAIDEVVSRSGWSASRVSAELVILELQGLITRAEDGGYINNA